MNKKPHFYTMFDLPVKEVHMYDKHDNVDRLSYLDTTLQIKSFMEAGKNIKYGFNDGLFKNEEDVENSGNAFTPVYREDPVVMKARIDNIQNEIVAELGKNANENVLTDNEKFAGSADKGNEEIVSK